MQLDLFINFNGNCREAAEFYAKVFQVEVGNLMTYGDTPPDPNYPVAEADKDKIMYAEIPLGGMTLMLMDMPSGSPTTIGDNITPTFSTDDKDEVTRFFNELKEGGVVLMELQKAFFSEWYGMVKDQFGVTWQILHDAPQ